MREFWAELLSSMGYGNLTALVTNCIFLLIVIQSLRNALDDDINVKMGYSFCSSYAQIWLVLNIIALCVLAGIQLVPENALLKMNLSALDLWTGVGRIFLFVRFMVLAIAVFETKVRRTRVCYAMLSKYDDGSFLFPLITIFIDVRGLWPRLNSLNTS